MVQVELLRVNAEEVVQEELAVELLQWAVLMAAQVGKFLLAVQFVSFGQVILVHSHQLAPAIFNQEKT
jgi:hypothetical protein